MFIIKFKDGITFNGQSEILVKGFANSKGQVVIYAWFLNDYYPVKLKDIDKIIKSE